VIEPGADYHFALGTTGTTYNMNDQNDLFSSLFFYDKLGRLVASQNAKQARIKTGSDSKRYVAFSYTKYDALGRIVEVGEMKKKANVTATDPAPFQPDAAYLNNPAFPQPVADASHTYLAHEVTQTAYDSPMLTTLYGFSQENLRNRVSSVSMDDDGNGTPEYSTYYSYDIHGNVKALIQDNVLLGATYASQRYKRIDYSYDLISGNVNQVSYQAKANLLGQYPLDRFFHKYEYDGDNRITNVYTSRDGILWDQDAKYYYYKHGPLARTEIGDLKVQGTDYAYTLQGWIKSVNAGVLNSSKDMGVDGEQSGFQYSTSETDIHKNVAKDAIGFNLHYFSTDYSAINSSAPAHLPTVTGAFASASNDLYNGNICKMVTAIKNVPSTGGNMPVQGTAYKYDQLNRIKEMNAFRNMSGSNDLIAANNTFSGATNDGSYHEEFSYDGNGNIMTLKRYGSSNTLMDEINYQYDWITNGTPADGIKSNRLYHVETSLAAAGTPFGSMDLPDQGAFTFSNPSTPGNINTDNNYGYDEIGNLVRDDIEQIASIEWNMKGKIRKIVRTSAATGKDDLEFLYDPMGIRIAKIAKPHGSTVENGGTDLPAQWKTTWYMHDATGNTMAVYKDEADGIGTGFYLNELHIYGSSRLGMLNVFPEAVPNASTGLNLLSASYDDAYNFRQLGTKNYELANHLGNVLAVVTDLKIPIASTVTPTQINSYEADVVSATDYYSFGSTMPGRNNSSTYRYGFNGMEKDNETKGNGNVYNTEFRQYDPRLSRWFSIDPKASAVESPYAGFANNPILFADPFGDTVRFGNGVNRTIDLKNGTQTTTDELANQTLNEWRQISGLDLRFDEHGEVQNYGVVTDDGVSMTARQDILDMINGDMTIFYFNTNVPTRARDNQSNFININPDEVNEMVQGASSDLNPLAMSYGITSLHERVHTKSGGGCLHSKETMSTFGETDDETVAHENKIRSELTQSTGTNFGYRASYIAITYNSKAYIPMSLKTLSDIKVFFYWKAHPTNILQKYGGIDIDTEIIKLQAP
jgi:RHS repeat-associated protein